MKVIRHSKIFALSFLLVLTVLAGGDDKNKKPANNAPPPAAPRQATQPPPQRTTNVYHPPNTGNTNVNRNTGNGNPAYRPNTNGGNNGTVNSRNGIVNSRNGSVNSSVRNGANNSGTTAGGNGARTNTNTVNSTGSTNKNGGYNPYGNRANTTGSGNVGRTSAMSRNFQPVRTTRDIGDKRVAYDRGGHVRDIHGRSIDVHRDVHGGRTFVAERNGRRIVGLGPHRGYMQRSYFNRNGRVYVQRTYVVGGVRYARAYRSYYWHGAVYYNYVSVAYYHPAFYGWAYSPWRAGVVWSWGWGPSPWYGYYGYYFAPYPVYPSASFWLTDYVVAQNLQLAYAAQQNADAPPPDQDAAAASGQVQLTPEVKQMIADEVQRQLAAERAAASSGGQTAPPSAEEMPSAMDPNSRVFVVASSLDVATEDGNECSLSPGDVIMRGNAPPNGTKVSVNVVTSKHGDCAGNTNTLVEISDLQEMQNQFREQMDAGLKVLADNQGKGGLPGAPDTSTVAGEVPPPAADSSAQADLEDQQKNAAQAEADVQKTGGTAQN